MSDEVLHRRKVMRPPPLPRPTPSAPPSPAAVTPAGERGVLRQWLEPTTRQNANEKGSGAPSRATSAPPAVAQPPAPSLPQITTTAISRSGRRNKDNVRHCLAECLRYGLLIAGKVDEAVHELPVRKRSQLSRVIAALQELQRQLSNR